MDAERKNELACIGLDPMTSGFHCYEPGLYDGQ